MNRQEFLKRLTDGLSQLPQAEIDKTVIFYSEMLDDMIEDGYTETDAIASMGAPEEIARQVLQDLPITTLVKSRVKSKMRLGAANIVLLVLGSPIWLTLLLALAVILLAVYAVIWSVIVALFAVVIGLALMSVMLIFSPLFPQFIYGISALSAVGMGFAGAGISILLFHTSVFISKMLIRMSASIIRGIKSLFIKRRENDEKSC